MTNLLLSFLLIFMCVCVCGGGCFGFILFLCFYQLGSTEILDMFFIQETQLDRFVALDQTSNFISITLLMCFFF